MLKNINRCLQSDYTAIMLIFFIAYKLTGPVLFLDPDVAWHIKAGELILSLKALPSFDTWSYVSQNQIWYNISWLWDVVVSLLHDSLGLNNLHTFTCLLYVFLLAMLYCSLKVWSGISNDSRFVVTSLSGIVLWDLMFLRPQLASYFLILAINYSLKVYKNTSNKTMLVVVPLLMIIWANMHGGFLLGLVIIGVYLLEAILNKRSTHSKSILVVFIISFLCVLINPYGYNIFYAIDRTFGSEIYKHIAEWGQFTFGRLYGASLIVLVFLSLALIPPPKLGIKIDLADKIFVFIALFASLYSVRYFGVLAILGAPYLAQTLEKYLHDDKQQHLKWLNNTKGVAYLMMLVFAGALVIVDDGKLYKEGQIPIEEVNFINEHYPNKKFFNNYNVGGYLIYFGEGKFKHFIDGRAGTTFSEEVIVDYLKYKNQLPDWQEIFKKYPTDGAVISHTELKFLEVDKFFRHWKEVYSGKYGKVFIKH